MAQPISAVPSGSTAAAGAALGTAAQPMDAAHQEEDDQRTRQGGGEAHPSTETTHGKVHVVEALGVDLHIRQAEITFLSVAPRVFRKEKGARVS